MQCFDGNNNYFQMWILIKWDLWIYGSQAGQQICWNKTFLRKTNNDIFLIINLLGTVVSQRCRAALYKERGTVNND